MTLSNFAENAIADALCNNVSVAVPQLYAKLHIGDPGEDCTANPAAETSRKAVSFGAASGGVCLNDAVATWTNVAAAETYSHGSLWDAASGGNPWGYGALGVPRAMQAGDTFDLPVAGVSFTFD